MTTLAGPRLGVTLSKRAGLASLESRPRHIMKTLGMERMMHTPCILFLLGAERSYAVGRGRPESA
jgi:hypothetical protein